MRVSAGTAFVISPISAASLADITFPVKINSAKAGFEAMFPENSFSAEGYDVPSGVNDQPMSSQETLEGATNRAQALQTLCPMADFFVGIEGGIETINDTLLASAWIVVIDRNGTSTLGRSGAFPLPPNVKRLVDSGIELGHANDQVFKQHNSKQQGGAVGNGQEDEQRDEVVEVGLRHRARVAREVARDESNAIGETFHP